MAARLTASSKGFLSAAPSIGLPCWSPTVSDLARGNPPIDPRQAARDGKGLLHRIAFGHLAALRIERVRAPAF